MTRLPGKRSRREQRGPTLPSQPPSATQTGHRLSRVLLLVSINLLVFLALLALLETAARIWFPRDLRAVFNNTEVFRRGRPYVQDHAERGFALRAGYTTPRMTVTRQGYRAHSPQQQEEELHADRVLCLGGSTTFGWGLADPESYPAQLQELLDEAIPNLPVSVINAGVPSYTSGQVLLYLQDLLELQPRLVVVQTMWNDLMFSFVENWFPGFLVHQRPNSWRRFLLKHSAVYRALRIQETDASRPVISSSAAQEYYRATLQRIVDECQQQNVTLVFSMPPLQTDFVPEDGMKIGQQLVPKPIFLQAAAQFEAILEDRAQTNGVALVRHRVSRAASPAQDLFMDPAHPLQPGYRLLAEDVAATILAVGSFEPVAATAQP